MTPFGSFTIFSAVYKWKYDVEALKAVYEVCNATNYIYKLIWVMSFEDLVWSKNEQKEFLCLAKMKEKKPQKLFVLL